jgi:L-amino acid N-acyltransferase YncA
MAYADRRLAPAERWDMIEITPSRTTDHAAIWEIIGPVIRQGETYTLPTDMTEFDAVQYWTGADRHCYVAKDGEQVVGTYYLRANQLGGGAHVANCGYMSHELARGRGVARAMCKHSLREAARLGFLAMQFNFVVETNQAAIHLWRAMGFEQVGRLPSAFRRPTGAYVDALVMFRRL